MERIVDYCGENPVVGVAIDAQLTMSLAAETGFRESDRQLRALLPSDCRNWVASINSLMAVPVRGRLLSEFLAPMVGTLLETHPRACLLFALGGDVDTAVRKYKGRAGDEATYTRTLWERWAKRFRIVHPTPASADGALDALVCATVAYLYHHAPENLLRLTDKASGIRGRGPFYVIASGSEREGIF
jgi:predicted nuclease with RNAse H fold